MEAPQPGTLQQRMFQLGLLAQQMGRDEWIRFIHETYPDGPWPPTLAVWDDAELREVHRIANHRSFKP